MKFEEFKLTCVVVNPDIDTIPSWRQGSTKCISCEYWPNSTIWLDEQGRCNTCSLRYKHLSEDVKVFDESSLCMGCTLRFVHLDPSGYCLKCRIQLTKEVSRIPSDASAATTKKVYGKYWCYKCSRFGATEMGRKCDDCVTDVPALERFRCMKCYQNKAFVLGGTCTNCAVQIGSCVKLPDRPALPPPRLVKYEKTAKGEWIERAIPLGAGKALVMSEKLGSDGRLGASQGE